MMESFSRLKFLFRYIVHAPWDSGVVPPEVQDYISNHPPGRLLDLGCGTGTCTLEFARHSWEVTGVDFIIFPIKKAQRRAAEENLYIRFFVSDVTRLPMQILSTVYTIILDIGCFHGLSPSRKTIYIEQLPRLLFPNGTWMVYGFLNNSTRESYNLPGLTEEDLELIQKYLYLEKRKDGFDRNKKPSNWLWFKNDPHKGR